MQPVSKLDIPALAASFDFRAVQLSLGGDYGKAEDAFRRLFPTPVMREAARLAAAEKGIRSLADWPMASRQTTEWGYVMFDAKTRDDAWCEPTDPRAVLEATCYVECPSLSDGLPYHIAVEYLSAAEIVPPKLTVVTGAKTMRELRENGRAA